MRAIGLAIGLIISIVSCAGQRPGLTSGGQNGTTKIPRQLVYEREVSGRVLAYDLQRPSGAVTDALGNIYLSDTGNHRVIKLDRDLIPLKDYGGYGNGVGKFINPEDIIIDRALNVYVLDTGNRRVVHLDANLNYVEEIIPQDDPEEIISNAAKLSGLQISALGEITVADYDNSRLIRLDNFNRFSRYIGDFGYGHGALLNPLGLAVDAKGQLYVADAGNGRVAVYDDYGNYLRDIGADSLVRPSAVTVSPYGTIWVADQGSQSVYAFSPSGAMLLHLGGPGRDDYHFRDIEAIAVSLDGQLILADSGNDRIMIYTIVYEADR